MKHHPRVQHPNELIDTKQHTLIFINDRLLDWITQHVLASIALFDLALIVPLVALPGPDSVKITLGVVSGSWIQLWALPALQRSSNKADAKREAKANADHIALTHIANQVDELVKRTTPKP